MEQTPLFPVQLQKDIPLPKAMERKSHVENISSLVLEVTYLFGCFNNLGLILKDNFDVWMGSHETYRDPAITSSNVAESSLGRLSSPRVC